jgi:hypothetical protein
MGVHPKTSTSKLPLGTNQAQVCTRDAVRLPRIFEISDWPDQYRANSEVFKFDLALTILEQIKANEQYGDQSELPWALW